MTTPFNDNLLIFMIRWFAHNDFTPNIYTLIQLANDLEAITKPHIRPAVTELPHDLLVKIARDSSTIAYHFEGIYHTNTGNRKVNAIKALRSLTNSSLLASKKAVEEAYNWSLVSTTETSTL